MIWLTTIISILSAFNLGGSLPLPLDPNGPEIGSGKAQQPPERTHWDDLADCESGWWDENGVPIEGSADWSYDGRDYGIFEGGLNFHPDTWDWLRPEHFPDSAADATREQEIFVAELVLSHQGWGAWPVCSRKVGLR